MTQERVEAKAGEARSRGNVRLALGLAAAALAVFAGFIVKSAIFGI
jgi:hypothetical protein